MLEELKHRVYEANMLLPQYGLVTFTWGNAECVCTMPPIWEKARYSSRWVWVSEDGLYRPSTFFPSKSIRTISSGLSLS